MAERPLVRQELPADVSDVLACDAVAGVERVLLRGYKSLSRLERAFRSLKMIDLHVRLIHHYTEPRRRAHVFLCMLACYVQWHMQRAWSPMLVADELPTPLQRKALERLGITRRV